MTQTYLHVEQCAMRLHRLLPPSSHRRPQRQRAFKTTATTARQPSPPFLSYENLFSILSSIIAPDSVVDAAPTPLGRGLVPPLPVSAGTPLLSVDWANLLIVTDEPRRDGHTFGTRAFTDWQQLHGPLPPALSEFILSPDATWAVRLAAWLLWLRSHGTGVWQLYTQMLPLESEMTCLMNYREDEMGELQDKRLIAMAQSERRQLADLHTSIFGSKNAPGLMILPGLAELQALRLAPEFEDVLWAMCMVNSRCFSEDINGEAVSLMVPCADFANHSTAPAAEYKYSADADAFQLVALRDLLPGKEACISYGCLHKTNAELMRDYGFVLEGNLCDRVSFEGGLFPLDNNITGVINSTSGVFSASTGTSTGASGVPSYRKPSLHAGRLMDVLGIEGGVRPGTGAFELCGMSAPEVLLAAQGEEGVAARRRVVTLLSLGEVLREVPREVRQGGSGISSGTGKSSGSSLIYKREWAPLAEEELQRERLSVAELRSRLLHQLKEMPTSIQTDEELLAGRGEGAVLGPRQRAAVAARLEIKRSIAAAAEALNAYSEALG